MQAFPKERPSFKLETRSVENPLPDSTLGYIGIAVEVQDPNEFPLWILAQPFDRAKIVGIDPFTIRFFRYENKSKSLQLASNSGSNVELGFIWTKISRPGIHVATLEAVTDRYRNWKRNMSFCIEVWILISMGLLLLELTNCSSVY